MPLLLYGEMAGAGRHCSALSTHSCSVGIPRGWRDTRGFFGVTNLKGRRYPQTARVPALHLHLHLHPSINAELAQPTCWLALRRCSPVQDAQNCRSATTLCGPRGRARRGSIFASCPGTNVDTLRL